MSARHNPSPDTRYTMKPSPPEPLERIFSILVLVVAVVSVYAIRTADPDLWGHLLYGQFFLEHGVVGVSDPFAYTTQGLRWYAHEYLAQMTMWWLYAQLGPIALIALKVLLGGGTLYLLYRSIRFVADDVRIWAPATMLASILLPQFFQFRPQLFTYLGMALFVFVLLRTLYDEPAPLWSLPLVTLVWANLHGGFLAGIGLLGLALGLRIIQSVRQNGLDVVGVWKNVRGLGATLVGCVIASLFTPLGWRMWPFLYVELGNPYNARYIEEWKPLQLTAPGWSGTLALFLLGLLLVAWGAARRRSIAGLKAWQWILSVLPVAWLAFRSVRHVSLLVIWGIPILALLAQAGWRRLHRRSAARLFVLACTGLILVPALIAVALTVADPLPRIRVTEESIGETSPFSAASFIRSNGLCGNVYNPLWWGSYLSWELYPNVLVSMDGRNDTVFPVEMIGENLAFYAGDLDGADIPARYDTDMLLVPADSDVLDRVLAAGQWDVLFEDQEAVLFLPTGVEPEDVMGRCTYPTQEGSPAASGFFR